MVCSLNILYSKSRKKLVNTSLNIQFSHVKIAQNKALSCFLRDFYYTLF